MQGITDHELLQSYARVLEFKIRKMQLDYHGSAESDRQADERIDAETDHDILELKYCTCKVDFINPRGQLC